ncbi:MAG: hypothetical protein IT208_00685 [Chthonomonadales bacterium]|nr:hypothetical protein [Chthonomonadales bacterium]
MLASSRVRWLLCVTLGLALLPARPAAAASALSVLPPSGVAAGWRTVGKPRVYNSRNLYDLIDGEAQAVLSYDFVACAHAEYAPPRQTKPVLTIDVFQMRTLMDAFGVFGSDRQSGRPIAIGVEGVRIEPSAINFWKGPFVVRCTIVQVTPAARGAMEGYARAAAKRIAGAAGLPAAVKALPAGRQARSERYVRRNVAGQSFLSNAVTARYPKLGQGAELFIAHLGSGAGAQAAFGKYRDYEKRAGTGLAPVKGLGSEGFRVNDRYAKNVVVARKGSYVVGVLRARDAAVAERLVRQALARLR